MCSRVRGCIDADAIATDPPRRRRRLFRVSTALPRKFSAPPKCRNQCRDVAFSAPGAMLREVELAEPSGSGRAAGDAEAVDVDDDDDDARLLPAALEPAGSAGQGTTGWARFWRRLRDALRAEPLLVQTLVGVAVGVVVGAVARATDPTPRAVELLGFPGELFMRLLRALVLPLVSVSMVCGVLALFETTRARSGAGRVVARLIGSYAVTTCVACVVGLAVVRVVRPGVGVSVAGAQCSAAGRSASKRADADADAFRPTETSALESALATARAAVPANLFAALAEGNVLGVIAASLFFATALAVNLPTAQNPAGHQTSRDREPSAPRLPATEKTECEKADARAGLRVVADACLGLNAVVETAVGWAVALMPLGVCSIVAARVAGACDPARALSALGKYVFAVLLGLGIHGLVALPAMFHAATARNVRGGGGGSGATESVRRSAFEVLRIGVPAFATAFATDSSSASLPRTLRCARRIGVPDSLAKFALPLGATLNMNGTALYEALTVLFIAQTHDADLSLGSTLVVAATSTVAAVGAAAIPSAGLVTMLLVLQAAGLAQYSDDVGALLALDWFLDRARTVVNVEGDLMVVAALAAWEARSDEAPREETETEDSG